MSVSVLAIGDPHFKVSNVRETAAMTEAIFRVATQKKPDFIVVLGDILDRHESIHVSPLTRATEFLARLTTLAPTYVLIGNHDLKNNRQFCSPEHPFASLKYWPNNITIVDTTTAATIQGHTFVFVPYVPPGMFEQALDRCPDWRQAACIFAHQEFYGCKMGAITSEEGDKWPPTNPYVVSGHIHDYQEPQLNILYTGTPIQHAFGDAHDKTISYLTFTASNNLPTLLLGNTPVLPYQERISLGLPRKYIVRITCAEVSAYEPPTNCELKIVIRGTAGETKAIKKHPNVENWKNAGHKISYKDIPVQRLVDVVDESKILKSHTPQKFSVVLFNAIKDAESLKTAYYKIFGSVNVGLELVAKPKTTLIAQPMTLTLRTSSS